MKKFLLLLAPFLSGCSLGALLGPPPEEKTTITTVEPVSVSAPVMARTTTKTTWDIDNPVPACPQLAK